MSIKLMSEVRQLDLKMSKKLILMFMADNANDEGTHCFPSIRRLAYEAGCSTRTVIAIIGELEAEGIVEKLSKGNQNSPNQYRVKPQAGKKLAPFKPSTWAKADEVAKGPSEDSSPADSSRKCNPQREQVKFTTSPGEVPNHITIRNHPEPSVFNTEKATTQPKAASSLLDYIPADFAVSSPGKEPKAGTAVGGSKGKRWTIVDIDRKTGGSIMGWK
jgi:predicted transcriptional regulator